MTKDEWRVAVLTRAELLREQEAEETRLRVEAEAVDREIEALRARREELERKMRPPWSAGAHVTDLLNFVCREEIAEGEGT